jgi:preprotein translocase subunit YajC
MVDGDDRPSTIDYRLSTIDLLNGQVSIRKAVRMNPIFQAFTAQTAPSGGGAFSLGSPLVMMLLVVGIFYLLVIRPQMKQQKQHQSFVGGLKKGDEVVTQGGIIGKVSLVEDRVITLDIGGGNKMRVLKQNVTGAWVERPEQADAAKTSEAKK